MTCGKIGYWWLRLWSVIGVSLPPCRWRCGYVFCHCCCCRDPGFEWHDRLSCSVFYFDLECWRLCCQIFAIRCSWISFFNCLKPYNCWISLEWVFLMTPQLHFFCGLMGLLWERLAFNSRWPYAPESLYSVLKSLCLIVSLSCNTKLVFCQAD